MAKGTIILGQILNLIPKALFDNLATRYEVDKGVRRMTAYMHLSVMLFAQFVGLPSLRRIEQATVALTPSQRRAGLTHACKSTMSEKNLRIPWEFYQALFYGLYATLKDRFPRHKFDLPGKLFSLDSTVIPLCLSLFRWAEYKTRKGGMKLHTLLDHDGYIPSVITVTAAKVHDIVEGRKFTFNKGDTLLFDRGYFDSAWFFKMCQQGVFFVTRSKINIGFQVIENRAVKRDTGICADMIVYLTGRCGELCPLPLRLVSFIDPETGNELHFLTNMLDVEATLICDLYRQRWQIETFFKWVKQNLKIKTFLGTYPNAVLVQIWIAMIAYLLVHGVQRTIPKDLVTTHNLLCFIATHALVGIPLDRSWQDFQRKKRKPENLIIDLSRNSS